MATIVLSAVGMAVGGSVGGSVLGLSSAVIGRAAGATLGQVIDQRLLGSGSNAVETGRIDRFRLTGASEGAAVPRVFGRMRVGGQIIWATRFVENSTTTGGKGSPRPRSTSYSYTVSLALALCQGRITRVGRIWADGVELSKDTLSLRVYDGSDDQLPDPKIEAVEGSGAVPAHRGLAYMVIEDLDLSLFGNRVPQFSVEVVSAANSGADKHDIADKIRAVALIPGSGEYTLATTHVTMSKGFGQTETVNIHTPTAQPDFLVSLDALVEELPNLNSVSMVVSWFGNDLRCGTCTIEPKVEQTGTDGSQPWRVSGLSRAAAQTVPQMAGEPVYGGTPNDLSVVQALTALAERGVGAVFYPFILMDQLAGNGLPDPWTGDANQPALPWRGRITTSIAPGQAGSPDQTALAEAEVASFFGTADPADFAVTGTEVIYTGPTDWGYRRFILHYAHLCAAVGGVSAFCIGSELRGLTQIRGAGGSFPAVAALQSLAADVAAILGPEVKIGYAADWSEYHGYQPPGTGDKIFHLDPLWADPNIGFIGIDNYMPLSDWRDGDDHADAAAGAIYDLDYLRGNVAGGEGYDWYYHSPEAKAAQIRTPIEDHYGEPWMWRVKDLRGWWQNRHFNRIGGTPEAYPTEWVPESKPIWFTEFGCAAVDKGTNEPNKFLDVKSSESALPYGSNGRQDELIQAQYLRAVIDHYSDPSNNPVSETFGHPMIDMSRAHVWAWDARPFPAFPANSGTWGDADNYGKGHWLNGRTSSRLLASVVSDLCQAAGLAAPDTSTLFGLVRGYMISDVTSTRAALQPLMLAHGFDAVEQDGRLQFRTRGIGQPAPLDPEFFARGETVPDGTYALTRSPSAEIAGRVGISYTEALGDYETRNVQAAFADDATLVEHRTELPMVLTRAEGQQIAERWLAEARQARDTVEFALPPSATGIAAGDMVRLGEAEYRIDRIEATEVLTVEAVQIDRSIYDPAQVEDEQIALRPFVAPTPVEALFLDLPLVTGEEVPHAPYVATTAMPWPGTVAVYSSVTDDSYAPNLTLDRPAVIGITQTPLFAAPSGLWDRGGALRVKLVRGALSSATQDSILSGRNLALIGDGSTGNWEVFQFANADLVAPDTYDLTLRLRGQAGTDAAMPADWPVGSNFVLLDAAMQQLNLAAAAVGTQTYLRFGPAARPIDDTSYRYRTEVFAGIGNRPLSPCHLKKTDIGGDHHFGWIRRTRIGGDTWTGTDVPVSEETERYQIRIIVDGQQKRLTEVPSPEFTYEAWMQLSDGVTGDYRIEVAQVSATYGAGLPRGMVVTL